MEKINGVIVPSTVAVDQLKEHADGVVSVDGFIHRIREMTGFSFVILRTMRDEVPLPRHWQRRCSTMKSP